MYSTGMWIEPITLQQRRNCTYGIRISYNIGFPCTSARSYSYPEMSESAIRQALYVGVEKLGYATVRPQQELAVLKFAAGQDVFVSLPTGSGKSLCYCVLPAVFDSLRGVKGLSIIVVVSPLIALMKDQIRAMMDRGTTAVYVGDCEDEQTVATVCSGQHQIEQGNICRANSVNTGTTCWEAGVVRLRRLLLFGRGTPQALHR